MTIKFGTDGWRAVVDRDFTPANVTQIIEAFADLYPSLPEAGRPVVIGYDCRNQSPETAHLISELLSARGIETYLSQTFCPTPVVSWNVVHSRAAVGIMVTASHNPPQWNGIKFKESYGGAASPDFTNPIEARIAARAASPSPRPSTKPAAVHKTDLVGPYLEHLRRFVDLQAIQRAHWKILFDPLYGAGMNLLSTMVDHVTQIHGTRDLTFGGIHPEPIIPYVNEAIATMERGQHDLCVITDGDADRIGAIDERGNYVTSHEIFALLLRHLAEERGWKGDVIKSITTTRMIDRLCARYGAQLTTTPVGFKHISPALKSPNMLMGGEESGGIGIPKHLCERDGILCALLLLEMTAQRGKRIGELVDELQREVGPCRYRRRDLTLTPDQMTTARARLQECAPTQLGGRQVTHVDRLDGHHFLRDDDSWLLIRGSGTEPLLRTYAEAKTIDEVDQLLGEARTIIGLE